jgi:Leucine-rich repeat (LRR) protein
MYFLILMVIVLAAPLKLQAFVCQASSCDSLIVRAILDSNHLEGIQVDSVITWNDEVFKSLSFQSLNMSTLPAGIGRISELKVLRLENNKLKHLPDDIGELHELIFLRLDNNRLKTIPSSFGLLKRLTWLLLHNNQINSLPPEIKGLKKLEFLSLEHNRLDSLPPELGRLARLVRLNLDHNLISVLPPEIGRLHSLTALRLQHNRLQELPGEIGALTSLRELDLSHNALGKLPPQITRLSPVRSLNVNHNNLCSLSYSQERWVNNFSDDKNWKQTQMLDPWHYCDGTPTDENKVILQPDLLNRSLTLTFEKPRGLKDIFIYTMHGHLLETFKGVEERLVWNAVLPEGSIYYIKILIQGRAFVRKFVL